MGDCRDTCEWLLLPVDGCVWMCTLVRIFKLLSFSFSIPDSICNKGFFEILLLLSSSFCKGKKIVKFSTKSNKRIFLNFGVLLFPLLVSINNDGKLFTNSLENILLNISSCYRKSCVKWFSNLFVVVFVQ